MRLLLTGSQGYVGSSFAEYANLSPNFSHIDGIDIGLFQNLHHYASMCSDIYLNSIIFKDLRKIEVKELVGYDAVIHLAAISNDPIGEKYSNITNEMNFFVAQIEL